MSDSPIHYASLALYLVEPSESVTDALTMLLADSVRTIHCFSCAESLLCECTELAPYRCLITELHLPGMSGIDLMQTLGCKHAWTPTIITAVDADLYTAVIAMKKGAIDFIEKPFVSAELLAGLYRVEQALRYAQSVEAES